VTNFDVEKKLYHFQNTLKYPLIYPPGIPCWAAEDRGSIPRLGAFVNILMKFKSRINDSAYYKKCQNTSTFKRERYASKFATTQDAHLPRLIFAFRGVPGVTVSQPCVTLTKKRSGQAKHLDSNRSFRLDNKDSYLVLLSLFSQFFQNYVKVSFSSPVINFD
jgi:hypothetical protein